MTNVKVIPLPKQTNTQTNKQNIYACFKSNIPGTLNHHQLYKYHKFKSTLEAKENIIVKFAYKCRNVETMYHITYTYEFT